jgi:tetratricopeptide (TPR) repeat protein
VSVLLDGADRSANRRTAPWRNRAGGPGRRLSTATIVVVALVAGLAVGRFFMVGDDRAAQTSPPVITTLSESIAAAERRAELNPDDPQAWQELAELYLHQAAQTGDPAFPTLAGQALDRADAIATDQVATTVGRGSLALTLHDFADARDYATSALEQQQGHTGALTIAVDANVELGDYDLAAERLQQLLDIRPGVAALSRTSYLRELNGDAEGAILAMSQAKAAASGAPFSEATVTTLLGDLHMGSGDVEKAADSYRAALALVADTPRAELGLARTEAARGDREAAITRLSELVERAPLPEAAILLVELHTAAGDAEAAADTVSLVRAMTDLQQASGQAVDLEMAIFEADHGDPDTAVELARAAYELRPDNIYAADALAWSLTRAGSPAEARPLVDEALRLGTRDAVSHHHAAVTLAEAGEDEAAAEHLRTAFDIDPRFTFAQRDEATTLAENLSVPVPEVWRDRS